MSFFDGISDAAYAVGDGFGAAYDDAFGSSVGADRIYAPQGTTAFEDVTLDHKSDLLTDANGNRLPGAVLKTTPAQGAASAYEFSFGGYDSAGAEHMGEIDARYDAFPGVARHSVVYDYEDFGIEEGSTAAAIGIWQQLDGAADGTPVVLDMFSMGTRYGARTAEILQDWGVTDDHPLVLNFYGDTLRGYTSADTIPAPVAGFLHQGYLGMGPQSDFQATLDGAWEKLVRDPQVSFARIRTQNDFTVPGDDPRGHGAGPDVQWPLVQSLRSDFRDYIVDGAGGHMELNRVASQQQIPSLDWLNALE